ncbi:hypothetical protein ES703_17172 [subsurface metagenome]
MLNFTENMKRIIDLANDALKHSQEEKYQNVREDLDNIHAHTTSAQQQLHALEFTKAQGRT